jgi:hypothetical protein
MGNLSERTFWIRTADPAESEAVTALLAASYSTLLSASYESDVLGRGLSHFTKANPALLSSLNAEPFYRAAGFETVRPMDLELAPSLAFPAVLMRLQIA